jgi:dienelactone hydrolase
LGLQLHGIVGSKAMRALIAGFCLGGKLGLDAGQPNRLTVRTIVASVMPAHAGMTL